MEKGTSWGMWPSPVLTLAPRERGAGAKGDLCRLRLHRKYCGDRRGSSRPSPCSRHPHTHVAHPLVQAVTLEFHYRHFLPIYLKAFHLCLKKKKILFSGFRKESSKEIAKHLCCLEDGAAKYYVLVPILHKHCRYIGRSEGNAFCSFPWKLQQMQRAQ